MRSELLRPYPAVDLGGDFSCGGSQNWFPDENFRRCGCGVIACADTLLYLRGQTELPQVEYIRYVNSLRRYFPLIPGRGIDGVRLAIGLNGCLRRAGLPVRAGWSLSGRRFWERLEGMLAEDLPAIVSIGPNFPKLWGREQVALYRRAADGAYTESERTRSHFLTALALDDEWMEVSSWGRRLGIRRADFDRYMRAQGALMTNLMFLERR